MRALRLLSFVSDLNCLPPGRGSLWTTWSYFPGNKEGLGPPAGGRRGVWVRGGMKLQSLEASLPLPDVHTCPLPAPRAAGSLQACEASCPGRRPRGGGGEPPALQDRGRSWAGSPPGAKGRGAPVPKSAVGDCGPARLALSLLPGLHSDLGLCPCGDNGFHPRGLPACQGRLGGHPLRRRPHSGFGSSGFSPPHLHITQTNPAWCELSVSLCVYCAALAGILLSTCFHLMEDIFL